MGCKKEVIQKSLTASHDSWARHLEDHQWYYEGLLSQKDPTNHILRKSSSQHIARLGACGDTVEWLTAKSVATVRCPGVEPESSDQDPVSESEFENGSRDRA